MEHLIDYKAMQRKVGENIERVRLQKKKNIKEMSALLNLCDSAYENIEKGACEIGIIKLFIIANYLGVPCMTLLETEENVNQQTNTNTNAHPNYRYIEKVYEQCIQQYREENAELKKQNALLLQKILSSKNE